MRFTAIALPVELSEVLTDKQTESHIQNRTADIRWRT